MKELSSVIAVLAVLLLSGCGSDSAAGSRNAVSIDCAIEIQIGVVTDVEWKPGTELTESDWHVASACVLPVHSTGGPGHVVSNTDGTIIELQWSDVRLIFDGKAIAFGDCKWAIKNRIDRRDGVKHTLGPVGPINRTLNFNSDFECLGSCAIDTATQHKTGNRLVIRGRYLPKAPPAQPLKLEEMAGL